MMMLIRPQIFTRRLLHSSVCLRDQPVPSPTAAALEPKLDPVNQWLESEGRQYRSIQPGETNYVSRYKACPFPMNPLFRPSPPLSDKFRDEVYRRFIASEHSDPVATLALQFHISEARVMAIVKLKQYQNTLTGKGKPLQLHFSHTMERLLQVNLRRPQLDVTSVQSIRAVPPYLLALDEQVEFDKEDALKLLRGARSPKPHVFPKVSSNQDPRSLSQIVNRDTRRGKFVFDLNASIPQGHVKRQFRNPLKTY